jgi:septal ring factor EnvC (AmiA/AmiB activator)
MLNWRRDPDHERKLALIERSIATSEQRIQDSERRTKQIESDIAQLRSETEQLREQNARGRQLLASMHALCLEGDSSSIPAPPMSAAIAPFSP